MLHLVSATWSNLRYLDLSENASSLTSSALAVFAKDTWSSLEKLCLHGNKMGPCMAELVQGNWPMLRYLDVGSPELNVVCVSKLDLGKWLLLECLELADNEFTPGVMHLLSLGNQAGLVLGENIITEFIVVSKGHWPQLQKVVFSKPEDDSKCIIGRRVSCDWGESGTCDDLSFFLSSNNRYCLACDTSDLVSTNT